MGTRDHAVGLKASLSYSLTPSKLLKHLIELSVYNFYHKASGLWPEEAEHTIQAQYWDSKYGILEKD